MTLEYVIPNYGQILLKPVLWSKIILLEAKRDNRVYTMHGQCVFDTWN
jgi:hypothetical protein